ncbi:MAG: c-type cytochrome biogenesis protein CcsB [Desulfobacterales bacterium]|nr:c-type cytochrome biogenesis protein CcsB [Desulfobacterales bacterium]
MNSSMILSIVTFVYAFSAVMYISAWIFDSRTPEKIALYTGLVGIAGNLVGFLLRWYESYGHGYGHIPLSNLYESLVFFALTIALIAIVIELRYNNFMISAFAMPLAFLAMAYASLNPSISDKIQPLIPALKSNWLTAHVVTCFLGYAGFATAFGIGVMYLVKEHLGGKEGGLISRMPEGYVLDELIQKTVMFGFLFLTIGIITGSVWANSAWGSYWTWDPKETWSLITWFVYAIMLHLRYMRGWGGARIAIISIVGFAAVMFTYFGVNYLPGLHSYGSM